MARISDLIDPLYQRTQEQKIQWQASDGTEIYCKLGQQLVELDFDVVGFDETLNISIRDKDGRLVEAYSPRASTDQAQKVRDIYELGRRQALRIDEAIDEVQRLLNAL